MTYKQVIEQSKTFTTQQRKQLGYYFLYPTLKKDKREQFEHFFEFNFDTIKDEIKKEQQENIIVEQNNEQHPGIAQLLKDTGILSDNNTKQNKKYSWFGCLKDVNKSSVDLQKEALHYR